jgi:hypothetical protein
MQHDRCQLRPVLTMKAVDAPSWEPALSFPLPENPSVELLDRARQEVLTYLDWVVHDVASTGDADLISTEIKRAAERLFEISLHWRPEVGAEFEEQLAKERIEREREWFQQQRQKSRPDNQP